MASKVISKVQTAGMGRVWLQPGGPGSSFLYGGCYGLNDITIPEGDLTPIFCPSPTTPNKWDIVDFIRGTPGNPTGSIEAPLDLVNHLLDINCAFGLQLRLQECDVPEDSNAWETMLHFKGARITSRGITQLNGRDPANNNLILTNADFTFEKMTFVKRMTFTAQTVVADDNLTAVSFCDEPSCPGNCGVGSAGCQIGYATTVDGIFKTEDGGANWTEITSPFAAIYDNVVDVACKGDLVIIVNGTTAGQVARSQDGGETWSVITLPDNILANSVFQLDSSRVWVVGADGYVWFSEDGGLTFTTQSSGGATTEDLNDVYFVDNDNGWAVGAAGAIIATTDGGDTWSAQTSGTANALNAVHFITRFIGYAAGAAGTVVQTTNGGTTWTVKAWFGGATDVINAITSCEEFVFFGGTTTTPTGFIYMSLDGGATARAQTLPANTGINDLFCCSPNSVFAAAQAGSLVKGA